jgi:hypothetical protein
MIPRRFAIQRSGSIAGHSRTRRLKSAYPRRKGRLFVKDWRGLEAVGVIDVLMQVILRQKTLRPTCNDASSQICDGVIECHSARRTPFMIESNVVQIRPVSQASSQIDIRKPQRQHLTGKPFGHNSREIRRNLGSKNWHGGSLISVLDSKIRKMFRMHKFDANVARFCRMGSGKARTDDWQKQQIKKIPHRIINLVSWENIPEIYCRPSTSPTG